MTTLDLVFVIAPIAVGLALSVRVVTRALRNRRRSVEIESGEDGPCIVITGYSMKNSLKILDTWKNGETNA